MTENHSTFAMNLRKSYTRLLFRLWAIWPTQSHSVIQCLSIAPCSKTVLTPRQCSSSENVRPTNYVQYPTSHQNTKLYSRFQSSCKFDKLNLFVTTYRHNKQCKMCYKVMVIWCTGAMLNQLEESSTISHKRAQDEKFQGSRVMFR